MSIEKQTPQEALHEKRQMDISELVRSVECDEPSETGLYLQLSHGRSDPAQDMDDWGTEGPYFGPLDFCHITYNASIALGIPVACDGGVIDHRATGPMVRPDPLHFFEDMLVYDGTFYGDWTLLMHTKETS